MISKIKSVKISKLWSKKEKQEPRVFIKACPVDKCKGFLDAKHGNVAFAKLTHAQNALMLSAKTKSRNMYAMKIRLKPPSL